MTVEDSKVQQGGLGDKPIFMYVDIYIHSFVGFLGCVCKGGTLPVTVNS